MPSASDIITAALQEIRAYAIGEEIAEADIGRGFEELNNLLGQWGAENLTVYQVSAISFPAVAQQSLYTIGLLANAGASINSARPQRITMGPAAASIVIGATTYSLNVIGESAWRIINLAAGTRQGTPSFLFYDPQFPLGAVNLLPIPDTAGTVTFSAWSPIVSFADPYAAYSLAPGVVNALKDSLALVLAPHFRDAQVSPLVAIMAASGKRALGQSGMPSRSYLPRLGAAAPQRG